LSERVYWDDEEKRKLIESVFVMRQNDPDSSLISIINRAQAQFPPDRQRNIPSVKVIPWLSDGLKERFRDMREKARALDSAKTEANAAKQNQTELRQQLNGLVEKARKDALKRLDTEDLVIEIMARMDASNNALLARVEALERKVGNGAPKPALASKPIAKKKPTILVVGMLPDQANNLQRRFQARADLRFLAGDAAGRSTPHAQAVVINGKFVAHKTQDLVRSAYSQLKHIHIVHGGQSIVASKIEEVLNLITDE
jgi:hypothetical protein